MIKNQKFGVEIELTGITKIKAAEVLAEVFGTGSGYGRMVNDQKNRVWKVIGDASIATCRGEAVEVVSPILTYDDIELIQQVLRELRHNGAIANDSCGIHVHVDGANHTPASIKNVMNFMCSRQDLIYEALAVKTSRERYCKKVCPALNKKFKKIKNLDRTAMENAWYSKVNHDYRDYGRTDHYNQTRYQCLNLHSYFTRGTLEFRMFNGTTHAGELKAYIQFALAVSAWAIETNDRNVFKSTDNYTAEQKAELMKGVLTNRLGMTGAEFKTARLHLTKHLKATALVAAA